MFLFKKKKKEEPVSIDSKYQMGERVNFHYKKFESKRGMICAIRQNENKEVVYDVIVGGECPVTWENIKEEDIFR